MPIIANNITEVRVKVNSNDGDKLQGVNNNMLIREIVKKKINKQTLLVIKCNLLTTYLKQDGNPLAQFMVSEDILFSGDVKDMDEIQKEWEKNKKLPKKFEKGIIEGVNTVCMYDLQFFTNRMRFPPATGFNFSISKETKKKKK